MRKVHEQHGKSYTTEYQCWRRMLSRCYNLNDVGYELYGGRGITVSDEFRDSFASWLEHIGKRTDSTFTQDRIDNSRGYERGNIKWSDKTEQVLNRRPQSNNTSGVVGVHWDNRRSKWIAQIKIAKKVKFLGQFDDKELASKARKLAEMERQ